MKIRLPLRKAGPLLKRPPQLKLKASVARSRRAPIVEEEDFLEEPEPNMKLSHAFVVVLVLHVIAVAGVFAFNSIKAKQADIFSAIKEEPAQTAAPEGGVASTTAAASDAAALTSDAKPEPVKPMAPAPVATNSPKTHELQSGETLTKVATTYGVSVADLESANNITDPTKIRAGTMLVIPGATAAVPAPEPAAAETSTYKPITAAPIEPLAPIEVPALKPAAPEPVTATIKDSGKIYVVLKGDNPWKIAKRLKVPYADVLALNGITDPSHLQIGQKLKIPASK